MTAKPNRPPAGEPWVWLTRELLISDAWRSQGINARRFVDFLLIEHMRHGGKDNGKLLAPYRQLGAFGIGDRRVSEAIAEAEEIGLVDCRRAGLRVATTYTLTWLPMHDGTTPSNRWREYRRPETLPDKGKADSPKKQKSARQREGSLPDKGKADSPNLPDKGKAVAPETLTDKGKALYRSSFHGEADTTGAGLGSAGDKP
jgi:hypothetical protein